VIVVPLAIFAVWLACALVMVVTDLAETEGTNR